MSTDCVLFVEKRERDGSWSTVDKWAHLAAQRARLIYPAGKITPDRLREAESMLLLENTGRGAARTPREAGWRVDQNYDLFGRLAGLRQRGPAIVAPRGLPPDMSELVARMARVDVGFGESAGNSHTPSWLLLCELMVLRDRNGNQPRAFHQFNVDVLQPMIKVHPEQDRVRAVFWFC